MTDRVLGCPLGANRARGASPRLRYAPPGRAPRGSPPSDGSHGERDWYESSSDEQGEEAAADVRPDAIDANADAQSTVADADTGRAGSFRAHACGVGFVCRTDAHGNSPQFTAGVACH